MTALGFMGGILGALLVIACHHALARRLDSHRRIRRRLHASTQSAKPITANATANPATNITIRITNPLGV